MNLHAGQISQPRLTYWKEGVAFFSVWRKSPSQVASVWPSSRKLVNTIADRECIRSAKTIVDLGPGMGGTTKAILRHAAVDCRVLAIEKTSDFIAPLESFNDARLTVHEGDAVELRRILKTHKMSSPDVIISGIPFSALPFKAAKSIIKSIHRELDDGGVFIAYQLRSDVADYARDRFGEPESKSWVLWNLPPLRIFTWRKRSVFSSDSERSVGLDSGA